MLLAWSSLFLALFWSRNCRVVTETCLIDQAINFSVVQSSWKVATFALVINSFITGERSLGRQDWVRKIVGPAPSVSDRTNCSNTVRWWAVALIDNFSGTVWIFFPEIICLGNDCVLIACITQIKLLFIWGLTVQNILDIKEFVSVKHGNCSHFERGAHWIFFRYVRMIVYISFLDIGAYFPEGVNEGPEHDNCQDTEDDMVGILIEEALLFFGSLSESFFSSFFHFRIGLVGGSRILLWRFGFRHESLKSFICNNVNV